MADVGFNTAFAIGVQSAFGTVNATIAALTGSLDETDGFVLGDRESGDAESGITFPLKAPDRRELAAVGMTRNFATFVREVMSGFAITYQLKGNGVTSTPTTDQAQPDPGLDALNQAAGFEGTSGADPLYVYTPAAAAVYATIKLWLGDLSFVFQDCLVGTRSTIYTPGDVMLRTDSIEIGAMNAAADGVTFPTIDYGNQGSLAAPSVINAPATWSAAKGWKSLEITVANNVVDEPDSSVALTGLRKVQVAPREIDLKGELYVLAADSDYEYQQLILQVAATDSFTFQIGTVASPAATLNAVLFALNNPQTDELKYNRSEGNVLLAEVGLSARDGTALAEYTETYN